MTPNNDLLSEILSLYKDIHRIEQRNPTEAEKYYRELQDIIRNIKSKASNTDRVILEKIENEVTRKIKRSRQIRSTTKIETSSIEEYIYIEKPDIEFKDIVNLEEAKKAIIAAVAGIINPKLGEGWTGILLYGPPGTGKTSLAKAVAHDFNLTFLYADFAQIMSKWVGESEKNLAKIFQTAREHCPSIIFFDEIDYLSEEKDSSGVSTRLTRILQAEMEGMKTRNGKPVIVIAATNYPWKLNEAILSRFQKRILVKLPDKQSRKKILEMKLKKYGIKTGRSLDLEKIAKATEGYSGRDIDALVKEVRELLLYEALSLNNTDIDDVRKIISKLENLKMPEAKQEHFEKALSKIKPVVGKKYLDTLKKWKEKWIGNK